MPLSREQLVSYIAGHIRQWGALAEAGVSFVESCTDIRVIVNGLALPFAEFISRFPVERATHACHYADVESSRLDDACTYLKNKTGSAFESLRVVALEWSDLQPFEYDPRIKSQEFGADTFLLGDISALVDGTFSEQTMASPFFFFGCEGEVKKGSGPMSDIVFLLADLFDGDLYVTFS